MSQPKLRFDNLPIWNTLRLILQDWMISWLHSGSVRLVGSYQLCVNHGPTTRIHYQDLYGNQAETQMNTIKHINGVRSRIWRRGDLYCQDDVKFAKNSTDVDFDLEERIQKLKDGVSNEKTKRNQI